MTEPVYGLKAIADRLGISLRRLHELRALPAGQRPPIRHGLRGYYAIPVMLKAWDDAHDMDDGVHREMKRGGRIEAALRGAPPPEAAPESGSEWRRRYGSPEHAKL